MGDRENAEIAPENNKSKLNDALCDTARWKCGKCQSEFGRLQIAWGVSGGEKVDVLDCFCPNCGNTGYKDEPQLVFMGTEKEKEDYWDKEWNGGFGA